MSHTSKGIKPKGRSTNRADILPARVPEPRSISRCQDKTLGGSSRQVLRETATSIISISGVSTISQTYSSLCYKEGCSTTAAAEEGTSLEGNSKDDETSVTINSLVKEGETQIVFGAGTTSGRANFQGLRLRTTDK
nr:hypothetical protein [Tanacetum cinerariifolium]